MTGIPAPGGAPLELAAGPVWVFTDLHLTAEAPEEIDAFCTSLAEAGRDLGALVVLGDLFDAWTGPEQWREGAFSRLARALGQRAAAGTRVVLLRGNRDVLLEAKDAAQVGAEVADAVRIHDPAGTVLASHGDEYCLRDGSYQRLRRWLRRPVVRRLARGLPWGLRRAAAARLRGISRGAVARKPLDSMSVEDDAVRHALATHRARAALVGHLHRAEERDLGDGRRLRVLPAWAPGTPPVVLGGEGAA